MKITINFARRPRMERISSLSVAFSEKPDSETLSALKAIQVDGSGMFTWDRGRWGFSENLFHSIVLEGRADYREGLQEVLNQLHDLFPGATLTTAHPKTLDGFTWAGETEFAF